MTAMQMRNEAGRVAGHCELMDVRLANSNFSIARVPDITNGLTYELEDEPLAQYTTGDEYLYIVINYKLNIFEISPPEDGKPSEELPVATLEFAYAGAFHSGEESDFLTEEVEAFARTTGAFALYPYAREYVSDVTGRMGLPPLTLGLYKI